MFWSHYFQLTLYIAFLVVNVALLNHPNSICIIHSISLNYCTATRYKLAISAWLQLLFYCFVEFLHFHPKPAAFISLYLSKQKFNEFHAPATR